MKRKFVSVLVTVAIALVLVTSSVMAAPAPVTTQHLGWGSLQPGQTQTFEQKVPIQIYLLGYDQNTVKKNALLSGLPAGYAPVVRYPVFYGLPGRDVGLQFDFDYKVTYVNNNVSNNFFKYLQKIGVAGNPTAFQAAYNDQQKNILDVTGPVLYIDGPSVEGWLAKNLPGRNPKGYTIVFVNWYGRSDFKFHVYTKTDVVDPDTGYNFGVARGSRKMIAWGGSASRLWFYDLSAGPESWTNNYIVDEKDIDGDGIENYRMPPIWEYASNGYRAPSALSSDLGKVARFVAIDLLFTTSPLYDPMVTAPGLNGDKIVNVSMLEDDPASLGTDWLNTSYARDALRSFEPYYNWRMKVKDFNPIDPGAQRALQIFGEVLQEDDCWNNFGTPFAELFCYFDMNRSAYVPTYKPNDYVAPVFAFNTTGATLGSQFGLLGFADDNWIDGTQSYVFAFDAAEYRTLGYGFSTTIVHEIGHHIGMSHPHDGYDSEMGIDFGVDNPYYFSWSGDESSTIMSYNDLSDQFGTFDRDNMYRWEMAGYLNWSNELLGLIQADPNANSVRNLVSMANMSASDATRSFANWDYLGAVKKAYQAFTLLSRAADQLGIQNPAVMAARIAVPSGTAPHEGDPIRFPDN